MSVLCAAFATPFAQSESKHNFIAALAKGLETASDPKYGFTPEQPLMLGGNGNPELGLHQVSLFLGLLRGPNGEKVKAKRVGTFIYFSDRDHLDEGEPCPCETMGDFYAISYRGLANPLTLAVSIYDYDNPRIPKGLTLDEKELRKLLQSTGLTPKKN